MDDFWLYQWIDEFDIATADQAEELLKARGGDASRRLRDLAAADRWGPLQPHSGSGHAILAGRGIDMSGQLDCCHRVCQTNQVDALFGRVLHYFDDIIVAGPPAHDYVDLLDQQDDRAFHNISEHVAALLYVRKIGLDSMLHFVQKPPACQIHYKQHAEEAGLTSLLDQADYWIDRLAEEAPDTKVDPHDDHWHFWFQHALLEHSVWGTLRGGPDGAPPTVRDMAEFVVARYVAHLVSDVEAAESLGVPLGASVALHESLLSEVEASADVVDADSVAFHLELPAISQLSLADVARIRAADGDAFDAFRNALRVAMDERLREGGTTDTVTRDIQQDVVQPALNEIGRRLKAAERSFARKAGASLFVGALTTTVGAIVGAPLVVGTGVAAAMSGLPAAHKYFDDKSSVELSDMYFLWKLQEEARWQAL